jgi:hypothetical protein
MDNPYNSDVTSSATATEETGWQVPNVIGWLNKQNEALRAQYASPSGRLDPIADLSADDFAKRYPNLPKEGVPALLDQYRLQRDLTAPLGRERALSVPEMLGSALYSIGAVYKNPDRTAAANLLAANPILGRYYADKDKARDVGLQSQLRNAEQLTKTTDSLVVKAAERAAMMKERQEMMKAIGAVDGGSAVPTGAPPAAATLSPVAAMPTSSGIPGIMLSSAVKAATSPTSASPAVTYGAGMPLAGRNNDDVTRAQIANVYGSKPMADLFMERWKASNAAAAELDKARAGKVAELETVAPIKSAEVLAGKRAEQTVEDETKAKNIAETATKMRQMFDGLEKYAAVPGVSHIMGPFDNSLVGRWVNQANPWAADSSVRDRIEGDATALAILAKKVIRDKGEGTFTEGDQAVLQGAIGNLLNSTDEKQYLKALGAARERFSTILGVDIPVPNRGGAGAAPAALGTTPTAAAPALGADQIKTFIDNAHNPDFLAAWKRRGLPIPHVPGSAPVNTGLSTMGGF